MKFLLNIPYNRKIWWVIFLLAYNIRMAIPYQTAKFIILAIAIWAQPPNSRQYFRLYGKCNNINL